MSELNDLPKYEPESKQQAPDSKVMEFLMTYGWAILIVLIAIGALTYFGVFDPDKSAIEKTTTTIEQAETTIAESEPATTIPAVTGRNCDPRAIRTNLITGETYCNRMIENSLDILIDDDYTTTTSSTTSSTTTTSSTSSTTTEETTSTIEDLGINSNSWRMRI